MRGYSQNTCISCSNSHVTCVRVSDDPAQPCKRCASRGVECIPKPRAPRPTVYKKHKKPEQAESRPLVTVVQAGLKIKIKSEKPKVKTAKPSKVRVAHVHGHARIAAVGGHAAGMRCHVGGADEEAGSACNASCGSSVGGSSVATVGSSFAASVATPEPTDAYAPPTYRGNNAAASHAPVLSFHNHSLGSHASFGVVPSLVTRGFYAGDDHVPGFESDFGLPTSPGRLGFSHWDEEPHGATVTQVDDDEDEEGHEEQAHVQEVHVQEAHVEEVHEEVKVGVPFSSTGAAAPRNAALDALPATPFAVGSAPTMPLETQQNYGRIVPAPRVSYLAGPLFGIKERDILAGFPNFPLFEAFDFEANLMFERFHRPVMTTIPEKVNLGYLTLLQQAGGSTLINNTDHAVIMSYVLLRSIIHTFGTFLHDADDETITQFFRAYLTPRDATFTTHDHIRKHGYLSLIMLSKDSPDLSVSSEIAMCLDKSDVNGLRSVLRGFRSIEYTVGLEGMLCVVCRFHVAGFVHKLVNDSGILKKVFFSSIQRMIEVRFISGAVLNVFCKYDEKHDRMIPVADTQQPDLYEICHTMVNGHRLLRTKIIAESAGKISSSSAFEFVNRGKIPM